jgi:hypothetical protein
MKRILTALVIGLSVMIGSVSGALAFDNSAEAIETCYQAPTTHCIFALALAEAKSIEDSDNHLNYDVSRPRLLQEIAEVKLKAGDIKGALATAKTIEGDSRRSGVLSDIAVAQAKAGDIKAAFATAKTIEDADDRSDALRGIAVALSSVKSD